MRIFRYEVPVDDRWHVIEMTSRDILFVGCRRPEVVEFWAHCFETPGALVTPRRFIVVGTGQPLPPRSEHVGTAVAPGGALVWHLLRERAS